MPHRITYSDDHDERFGSRIADPSEAVVDSILARTPWSGTVELDAALPHVEFISVYPRWKTEDLGEGREWLVDVCFQCPELSGDLSWFASNLFAEAVEGNLAPLAGITGVPIQVERPLDAGAGTVEMWHDDVPGGVVSWPLPRTLTYFELASVAGRLDACLGGVAQTALRLCTGVEAVPPPRRRRAPVRVFLCHSSRDKPFARRLVQALRAAAIDVWFDEDQILVGHDFIEMMERGLDESDFVVVVLSPNFTEGGPWARQELRHALTRQVHSGEVVLLPVLLEDCEIPPLMASRSFADFRESFLLGLNRLVQSILTHSLRCEQPRGQGRPLQTVRPAVSSTLGRPG